MVLVPEPVDWLEAVAGSRLAPWALPFRGPGGFFRRRYLAGARTQLGWTGLEAVLRLWAGNDTARGMQARFALRGLAARWATAEPEDEVVAPSLAALELFARHPGRKILLLDLPLLRELHADLDAAAAANPSSRFLHRYRADREVVVRQEQELALADEVWVRGEYAAGQLEQRGLNWEPFVPGDNAVTAQRGSGILLAGMASARHGLPTLLRVVEAHREWKLHVNCGPGTEPANLLAHPQVVMARGFEAVGVVAAPSWVECYPAEVARGHHLGLPVVATARAAGFTPVLEVEPGDADGLERALCQALDGFG